MLVVDDEAANRRVVRLVLEQAGWPVVEAADGVEAIDAARRTLPSLVLMDIDMPNRNGFDAVLALRGSAPPLSSVPILIYSAMPLGDDDIRRRGMDGRVPKPFTPDQLIATVAPWLGGGELAGAERLAGIFGEAELARLVAGLRDQLASAVEAMDCAATPDVAHRIAGLAGTLGFAAVSASWLALSQGDESARDQARRDARLAIAAIDRRGAMPPDH